jgi:hypothetical protein
MPVRVIDSNAWERIFDLTVSEWTPIRAALANGRLKGFICEAGFRIEAIRKGESRVLFCSTAFRLIPRRHCHARRQAGLH